MTPEQQMKITVHILKTSQITDFNKHAFEVIVKYPEMFDIELACRLFVGKTDAFHFFYINKVDATTPLICLVTLQLLITKSVHLTNLHKDLRNECIAHANQLLGQRSGNFALQYICDEFIRLLS